MKKIKNYIMLTLATVGLMAGLAAPAIVHAAPASDPGSQACSGITDAFGGTCDASDSAGAKKAVGGIFGKVVNILSYIIGGICVIMIIIGGFRYIVSGGDQSGVSGAKNTILYALVGLAIVIFAQVIVKFVIGNLGTK